MKQYIFYILLFISTSFLSCKNRDVNYITYYNKVNEIDSIYRMANQPEKAVKKFRQLFRKYEPRNQEYIEEYETYITLADHYHKNFGGKKSLYKLITLVAPYGKEYKKLYPLCQKYEIDSVEVDEKVADWKKNLNRRLVDSFSIAMIRDQEGRPENITLVKKNIEKNMNLFLWTFKHYGFPDDQKTGRLGNNDIFIALPTLLSHMIASEKYPEFRKKVFEYVKSGDCSPRDYALMSDTYDQFKNTAIRFAYRNANQDSARINRSRKGIGIPSLKHSSKIRKDKFKKK
ncbi:hypothetical protein [Chryseobacterium luteum]|uniref:Lipoprotein n=1 Tax=Chryseobacterium luteum TaxID=421531 RepID=A0A085YYM2_9FLAO|nr:hypothetical protein [Chryseobacterium luteum]KFE97285.1 hypothetical protein IX38_20795 [Chryseobacterium luteum]